MKKVTIDTTILVEIGKGNISWSEILNVFINGTPIRCFVTSAALQEYHKDKTLPDRLEILQNLSSYRNGYGSGLYGQGLYGGTAVHKAETIASILTVGFFEVGSGDRIGSQEDIEGLEQILKILTNGASKGWDRKKLSDGQKRNYRDAQAFEAHIKFGHDIFITNDGDYNKLKDHYQTTICTFGEYKLLSTFDKRVLVS